MKWVAGKKTRKLGTTIGCDPRTEISHGIANETFDLGRQYFI